MFIGEKMDVYFDGVIDGCFTAAYITVEECWDGTHCAITNILEMCGKDRTVFDDRNGLGAIVANGKRITSNSPIQYIPYRDKELDMPAVQQVSCPDYW